MTRENKISTFQFFVLGCFISQALFVGMGNIILVFTVKENTWLIAIIASIIGIIPILLLNKIFNYEPSLNIFEKIKKLFGNKIGIVINLLLSIIVLTILLINIWAATNFANTKYLTETPSLFIALMLILPVIYANIKGIETIGRTSEVLFYFTIIIYIIITISLMKFINIDNLKPILNISRTTITYGILKFLSYILVPFIALTAIPKDNVVDKRKFKKALIGGYFLGAFFMTLVFFVNMSVLGIGIVSLYRYPEYYVIKKVSIMNAIDNIENFLSIHWMFNLIIAIMLNVHFISEFIFNNFKVKNITRKIIIILIGLSGAFVSSKMFKNTTSSNAFMDYSFPIYIALPLLLLCILIMIFIKFKTKKSKT